MNNDGTLVVNFSALMQAGGDIQRALNTLESQLSQLESDARPLVDTWDGPAKQAYAQRQAQWRTASEDLKALLRDIKGAVDDSAVDYQATENRNRDLFAG